MARYTGPSCRICRREGQKLYLKGDRCYSDKCTLNKRQTAPGQHGAKRTKLSGYGTQLREKQKVKKYYGLLEGQFKLIYDKAEKMKGIAGENLLQLLELRLDNVVYRLGFANSRKEARQLVVHGHFTLNGHKADIPSMTLEIGDLIALKDKSKSSDKFKQLAEVAKTVPGWLEVNFEKMEGKLTALPVRNDIDLPVEEHLIVELYSR
ncbi:30S ribosomal protein S4 [Fusibacter sp. 3D3]|uniref:30S ribosomal protein S4 n=1 Tax=Fusibacter sp. 3D3 TaxID=1048380 RepID=UPI0008537646|nr:30S ribosomal protein S4 [Fusibacter sp. 3D3]GAU79333.1 small subunit ribosomal protein S4p [Fusibacter sp. 3D3]